MTWNAITLMCKDHYDYGMNQWETTLQWSVISHWPSPYPVCSPACRHRNSIAVPRHVDTLNTIVLVNCKTRTRYFECCHIHVSPSKKLPSKMGGRDERRLSPDWNSGILSYRLCHIAKTFSLPFTCIYFTQLFLHRMMSHKATSVCRPKETSMACYFMYHQS